MPFVSYSPGLPVSLGAIAFLAVAVAGIAWIVMQARRELAETLKRRARLLDEAAAIIEAPSLTIGADGYPTLIGRRKDRRITLEVIADSLVARRLPQLWLKMAVDAREAGSGPSIGVLARPTGSEFYSRVLGLPDMLRPNFAAEFPMLVRGRDVTDAALARTGALFRSLFSDPALKEAIVTPRGCGLVRQIAQGDRAAHVLYRQIRFPVTSVPTALIRTALADLDRLDAAFQPSTNTETAA